MFLTISYVSNVSDQLTKEDIKQLMMKIKRDNNSKNIRGILIYVNKTFFQIIEGEYTQIKSLYGKIKTDGRHQHILKILEKKSTTRRYRNFNSNYITYCNERPSADLLNFLESNNHNMPDKKLSDLIVYQSKVLLNMY